MKPGSKILLVVNTDWFFLSHRLPLAFFLRDKGLEVVVASSRSAAAREIEQAGFRFEEIPFARAYASPLRELRVFVSLVALYRREKPDLVHHFTIKPVLYGSLAALVARVPAVVNTLTGLGFLFTDRGDKSTSPWIQRGVKTAYRLLFRHPSIRTVLQNTRDCHELIAQGIASPTHVALIQGVGVNTKRFLPSVLPPGVPWVILPARLIWDKGVHEFVEAAREIQRKGGLVQFALVGPLDAAYPHAVHERQVRSWEQEGVLTWWGPIPHREMPAVYARAHLVVLPSYREGLPLVLAEAAACGRACVATDVPGCSDIVQHGKTGWLVPPRKSLLLAAAIEEALQDPEELLRRGQQGRLWVEQGFSVETINTQTLRLYQTLGGAQISSPATRAWPPLRSAEEKQVDSSRTVAERTRRT